jgi:hypothetical protein
LGSQGQFLDLGGRGGGSEDGGEAALNELRIGVSSLEDDGYVLGWGDEA